MSLQSRVKTETDSERRARIREALTRNPSQMTLQLARDLGVSEAEVVRAFPDDRAVETHALSRPMPSRGVAFNSARSRNPWPA